MSLFPHEVCIIGGQLIEKRDHLSTGFIAKQNIKVIAEMVQTTVAQLVCETPFDQCPLFSEVDPVFFFDKAG